MNWIAEAKRWDDNTWIAVILRLCIVSLYGIAGVDKLVDGLGNFVTYVDSYLEASWIPRELAIAYAWAMPFVQLALAAWLASGFRLRIAWIACALYTISIAIGSELAGRYGAGANAYMFAAMCLAGLYFCRWDRLVPKSSQAD
jgi:hypothetical protein